MRNRFENVPTDMAALTQGAATALPSLGRSDWSKWRSVRLLRVRQLDTGWSTAPAK